MLLEIPGLTPDQCVVLARSRTYSQYVRAVVEALEGRCPFCQIDRTHNNVVFEDQHWLVWPCNPPEANTALHYLIVPRRHVQNLLELDFHEWSRLQHVLRWVHLGDNIQSSGILCRNGNATLSAGTVPHLHIHVMVPNGTGRVESPFYKGAESEAEGHLRAIVFEKLRTGANYRDLSAEEQARVKGRV